MSEELWRVCDETVELYIKMKGMRARAKHANIKYKETCKVFEFIGWTITKFSKYSSIIVEQFVAAITCYQLCSCSWQILNIIFSILCKLI